MLPNNKVAGIWEIEKVLGLQKMDNFLLNPLILILEQLNAKLFKSFYAY